MNVFRKLPVLLFLSVAAIAPAVAVPATVPNFTIRTESGKPITLSSLRGKLVLVNFFGVWCAPCKEELPWFEEFSKKYQSKGLVVLGAVEESGSWTRVSPLKQKMGITYQWGMDADDSFTRFKADALPSTVLVGRDGQVLYVHTGMISKDEMAKVIEASR